jgi:two-component system nitrate/nitrite response regulator NarL
MTKKPNKIRLLIIDDHTIVREGLRSCLSEREHLEVIGEGGNGEEALVLAEKHSPDVIVMDINMPKLNGLEATRLLSKKFPKIKILILTVHDKKQYVLEILRSGAKGYLLKDAGAEQLVQAIESVHANQGFFSPPIAKLILDHHIHSDKNQEQSFTPNLSIREREIIGLITKELKNKEIADRLGISVRTVETYRERIMRKLDIHTTVGLIKYAISTGIINLESEGDCIIRRTGTSKNA